MSETNRYAPYAKETAICVDLAYGSVEDDIASEIRSATAETREALNRILQKISSRRSALDSFIDMTRPRS